LNGLLRQSQSEEKKSSGKGVRTRHASVYPGKTRCGLAFAIADGRKIVYQAVGTVDTSQVAGILETFQPDALYYATDRIEGTGAVVPIPGDINTLRVARRGWYNLNVYNPIRQLSGKFGNYAYRIMFSELILWGDFFLTGNRKVHPLDDAWLEAHSPPRILR